MVQQEKLGYEESITAAHLHGEDAMKIVAPAEVGLDRQYLEITPVDPHC